MYFLTNITKKLKNGCITIEKKCITIIFILMFEDNFGFSDCKTENEELTIRPL